MKYFIGLDLSLTGTGVVILDEKGKIIIQELIKSKKTGDRPVEEMQRIMDIRNRIFSVINGVVQDGDVPYFSIEGLAFMAKGTSLVQLSALNYLVREWIVYDDNMFIAIAPTSLKRFITGRGNAKKDEMMLEVYKQYGFSFRDDNLCDAFSLAVVLRTIIQKVKPSNQFQRDTINLIQKQL